MQNQPPNLDAIIETIAAQLCQLREQEWEYPIFGFSISTNGNVNVIEYVADHMNGVARRQYVREEPARLPIYVVFLESSGRFKSAALTIDTPEALTAMISPGITHRRLIQTMSPERFGSCRSRLLISESQIGWIDLLMP